MHTANPLIIRLDFAKENLNNSFSLFLFFEGVFDGFFASS